jgi:lipid-A-disaccharide synthase
VWASREGRAYQMARDFDLLLSIFPFEKAWYSQRVPGFPVEFVGHPMMDRFAAAPASGAGLPPTALPPAPRLLLLPGSRPGELSRHLPAMIGALALIRASFPGLTATMVLPNESLLAQAKASGLPPDLEIRLGGLSGALSEADLAMASTGTVTMECAFFGVPTVALYKTSWTTYQIARHIVKVKYLAMPNILANAPVFPEFVQGVATAKNLAGAALELLRDPHRRAETKAGLAAIVASLGGAGAAQRAAKAILKVVA